MVACLQGPIKRYSGFVDYDEKLRLCRASFDAFNRRDLERLFRLYHPECEWHMSHYEGWPEDRIYRGREGLKEFFTAWLDPWEDFHAGYTDAIDLPGDRVFLLADGRGQGRLSHAPVEIPPFAQITDFRDGTVLRVDTYSAIEAARADAGV